MTTQDDSASPLDIPVRGWMPIETAPEEGQFLVYMPEDKRSPIQVAKWLPNVKVIGNQFAFDLHKPTHWMPLPEAPNAGVTDLAPEREKKK